MFNRCHFKHQNILFGQNSDDSLAVLGCQSYLNEISLVLFDMHRFYSRNMIEGKFQLPSQYVARLY